MSGIHGQVFGHLARRGFEVAQSHFGGQQQAYITQLQEDAKLYEQAGPEMEVQPYEILPVVITAFVAILIIASVRYTVGEVIATLAMIESPTSTAIIEDKPPAYADEPDAPLEKAPLMPSEAEADLEVTLIRNKPITSKITTTIGHLQAVGGFRSRWRGLVPGVLYHVFHSIVTNFWNSLLGGSFVGYTLIYVLVSLAMARLHMVWTHSMIAHPSAKPWWRRLVARKQARVVLLPSLVYAVAQQATLLLPLLVAVTLGVHDINKDDFLRAADNKGCSGSSVLLGLRIIAVPMTAIFTALMLLLPASITLTRVEAALLPEDQETIVPFDRLAILGNVDVAVRGAPKAIFSQAWRSVDSSSRWRIIKLYAKMVLIQFTVAVTALHLMMVEVYVAGSERLAIVTKSSVAQLKLMAIDAQDQVQTAAN